MHRFFVGEERKLRSIAYQILPLSPRAPDREFAAV